MSGGDAAHPSRGEPGLAGRPGGLAVGGWCWWGMGKVLGCVDTALVLFVTFNPVPRADLSGWGFPTWETESIGKCWRCV